MARDQAPFESLTTRNLSQNNQNEIITVAG